ncbi:hypothetical protein I317_04732 [Kwoniella heveanensis CBS 569]|nr:hypothetical protein I317_04732 [Kwoniella heveanensis CBS 569]
MSRIPTPSLLSRSDVKQDRSPATAAGARAHDQLSLQDQEHDQYPDSRPEAEMARDESENEGGEQHPVRYEFQLDEENSPRQASGAGTGAGVGVGVGALPRVDGGWGAWTYLAAATGLELLNNWCICAILGGIVCGLSERHADLESQQGFANSYGVFLENYDALYPQSRSLLPVVGTIAVVSLPICMLVGVSTSSPAVQCSDWGL